MPHAVHSLGRLEEWLARRRKRGGGLMGLILIGAVLYFTGAGAWLWERTKQLPDACYGLLAQMGTSMGEPVCRGLSASIDAISGGTSGMLDKMRGMGDAGGNINMGEYAQSLLDRIGQGGASLSGMTSSGSRLSDMMGQQPIVLPSAAAAKDRMRMALDQFVIGQHYLQSGSLSQGLPWLQQSARQPGGYGVLSQLTLGDMYRTGGYGVGQNQMLSRGYYEQAVQSIGNLQAANTPQSRQMLQSLPAPASQLSAQLQEQLRRMQ